MVNAVNGHGNGQYTGTLSQSNQPSAPTETAQETSRPGKGKAGAPGQLAKQMLGGTPPPGFSLGNLVSIIAHGDMEGAQNLVNSLTPPPAEEPIIDSESTEEAALAETTDPNVLLSDVDQSGVETIAVSEDNEETEVTTAPEESSAAVEEPISLNSDVVSEASLLDLFEAVVEEDVTA